MHKHKEAKTQQQICIIKQIHLKERYFRRWIETCIGTYTSTHKQTETCPEKHTFLHVQAFRNTYKHKQNLTYTYSQIN